VVAVADPPSQGVAGFVQVQLGADHPPIALIVQDLEHGLGEAFAHYGRIFKTLHLRAGVSQAEGLERCRCGRGR